MKANGDGSSRFESASPRGRRRSAWVVGVSTRPQTRTQNIMKNLRALLAFIVVLVLAGCQGSKHARVATNENVASSELIYTFVQRFLAYFGPEGITKIQKALREAHPNHRIQVDISDSYK